MTRARRIIDVTEVPELLSLAEEVHTTNEPRVLRRNNEDLAVVKPLRAAAKRRRRHTTAEDDLATFRSAAGSWEDVGTDAFLNDVAESRRISSRPPVDL